MPIRRSRPVKRFCLRWSWTVSTQWHREVVRKHRQDKITTRLATGMPQRQNTEPKSPAAHQSRPVDTFTPSLARALAGSHETETHCAGRCKPCSHLATCCRQPCTAVPVRSKQLRRLSRINKICCLHVLGEVVWEIASHLSCEMRHIALQQGVAQMRLACVRCQQSGKSTAPIMNTSLRPGLAQRSLTLHLRCMTWSMEARNRPICG